MKKVLITLCGRAGSKGFKNKNLKIFCGQPLVYYSLAGAELLKRQRPDIAVEVCLNTDSEPLRETVMAKYPETVYIPRPEALAGDVVGKMAVMRQSLLAMEAQGHGPYDYLIDLDITSPLRQAQDVNGALSMKEQRPDIEVLLSGTPSRRTPYMNQAKLVEGGFVTKVMDHHFTARQQTPKVYDINASIYVFETDFLRQRDTDFVWDGACGLYEMMDTGILDIDSEEDFRLLEVIGTHLYENEPGFKAVRDAIRR